MADKKHLLMRLDSEWLGYPLHDVEEMLDDLTMNVVQAVGAYESMVSDERALRTMFAGDFPEGGDGWDIVQIAQHELDAREANPHDRTPLIVTVPLLPYLFGSDDNSPERSDMLAALLTRGPDVNMHVVAGLNVAPSFADYAAKAFTSIPAELRTLFRRVSVGADADDHDLHSGLKFFRALEEMVEVPVSPNPGQSFNSFFRPNCSECGSEAVTWFAFNDFRILNEDYPKVIEKLDEAAEVVGEGGQVWRCESCGDWGVTSKPQYES